MRGPIVDAPCPDLKAGPKPPPATGAEIVLIALPDPPPAGREHRAMLRHLPGVDCGGWAFFCRLLLWATRNTAAGPPDRAPEDRIG